MEKWKSLGLIDFLHWSFGLLGTDEVGVVAVVVVVVRHRRADVVVDDDDEEDTGG